MIIHKTMRMPSSCTMCWISNTCDVWSTETRKQNGYDKRLEDCPLEEVKTGTPTVDAVQVVRCKDCKHAKEIPWIHEWDYSCEYFNTHSVMANDYCSRAERRDE